MKSIFQTIINTIKPFLPLGADQAHSVVERLVTIPRKDRMKLYAGMGPEEVLHAEGLWEPIADQLSDYLVYVASRGAIEED